MATATAYQALNMDTMSIWFGTTTIADSTHIQIIDGTHLKNFYGSFTYYEGILDGGTLTQFDEYESGVQLYQVTGLSLDSIHFNSYTDMGELLRYTFSGNDTLIGSAYDDNADGFDGDDIINGYAGNDLMNGNGGNDTLNGGAGNDYLFGLAGNDTLIGGAGNDYLKGGIGNDTASYASANREVRVNLGITAYQETRGAGSDKLIGIENLIGSTYSDTLIGNSANNRITGGLGNDVLSGGTGNDYLNGGRGNDYALYSTATAAVSINLKVTTAQATGGAGSDTLIGIEKLAGSIYADTLTGNASNNTLLGGLGDDTMRGNSGNDQLFGGAGRDLLSGGNGADTFVFDKTLNRLTNIDTITDFNPLADTFNLDRTYFAKLTTTGTLLSSQFRGNRTGQAVDSNDYLLYNMSTGAVLYDRDGSGSGAAVQFATLTNRPQNVTAADFTVIA